MSEHTPTPWRVEQNTTLIWGACNPDDMTSWGMGKPIAECRIEYGPQRNHTGEDEAAANAALIVRAVNSHAALRAALSKIADEAEEFSHGDQNAQSIVRGLAAIARRALEEA